MNSSPKMCLLGDNRIESRTSSTSSVAAEPVEGGMHLSALAERVYDAMGPGTPTLPYMVIMQRSRLFLEDVLLGLEELQHKHRIVLIHRKGDILRQMAFRMIATDDLIGG